VHGKWMRCGSRMLSSGYAGVASVPVADTAAAGVLEEGGERCKSIKVNCVSGMMHTLRGCSLIVVEVARPDWLSRRASMWPDSPPLSSHHMVTAIITALALMLPHIGNAQSLKKKEAVGLEGSWSGGGTVSFASGSRERASCRAHYRRAGTSSYAVSATCATPSGRAVQTATIRQVGADTYSGSFYNSEYSISGVMHVVVHGGSQTVRLNSDSGSAVISLSRSR
jgi:hypothetical protein